MTLAIDHLVIAALTLEEGASWLESRLGVAPVGGGKHALMSTHNRLLSLGDGRYLEVIAVDRAAPDPGRARWYALDSEAMHARLQRGPALIHWAAVTTDIVADAPRAPVDLGEVLELARGDLRWRLTVPADGSLPGAGTFPTLIQWRGRSAAMVLPDSGCRLESIDLAHPSAGNFYAALRSMGLPEREPVSFTEAPAGLAARIRTPGGIAVLA